MIFDDWMQVQAGPQRWAHDYFEGVQSSWSSGRFDDILNGGLPGGGLSLGGETGLVIDVGGVDGGVFEIDRGHSAVAQDAGQPQNFLVDDVAVAGPTAGGPSYSQRLLFEGFAGGSLARSAGWG